MQNQNSIFMLSRPMLDMTAFFLLANLIARLPVLYNFGLNIPALLLAASVFFLFFLRTPRLVDYFCFLFGISFPVYCYQSYTVNSQLFGFLTIFLGLILWFRIRTSGKTRALNGTVAVLLSCCVLVALFSLALFPVSSMARLFSLWSFCDFSNAMFTAPPDSPLYSLAGADRLLLFAIMILLLSSQNDARRLYGQLFKGAVIGGVLAALLGILNQYGLIDLTWFRPQFLDPSGVPRLHSVTGNPGWFAQYLLGSLPFVLLLPLFFRGPVLIRRLGLAVIYLLCGMALLLTGSRTGWLILPVVITFCSMAVVLPNSSSGGLPAGAVLRSAIRTGALLLLVVLISVGLFSIVGQKKTVKKIGLGNARIHYIMQRWRHVLKPGERSKVWRQSLILGMESPVFGLGYAGFKWHQKVMTSIPKSTFARNRQTSNNWDTPHSFPLQLFISNGLAGIALWFLLLAYVFVLLWKDFIRHNHRPAAAALISMTSLLFYGLTQSLPYIPLIWFLFFLSIGYALTVSGNVLPHRLQRARPVCLVFAFLLVVSGAGFYLAHAQSRYLARRYGIISYSDDRKSVQYVGFYPKEDWGSEGTFRWSGARAEIRFKATGVLKFTFVCNTPGLGLDPVQLEVLLENVPVDHYTFWRFGKIRRSYLIPASGAEKTTTVELRVSRTWNPLLAGQGNDTRNLGIAVAGPRVAAALPKNGIGFGPRHFEKRKTGLLTYRWTGQTAVLPLKQYRGRNLTVELKSMLPFITQSPLMVYLYQNNQQVASLRIKDHHWHKLRLPENIRYSIPLQFRVSKTWNPRLTGYGGNPTDLGIALSLSEGDGDSTYQRKSRRP